MESKDDTPDIKVNLSNLTKIPAKEFERHFREWMERDDVARSLQSKLRSDLIINFNKTSLGKQILAQTTTTTTGGYGTAGGGSSSARLTLSPLTLALNTLAAEFLYAQNCHFTLSVFCTEVPYRNTLPDFESTRYFRFTELEIGEIVDAITGMVTVNEKQNLTKLVSKDYMENANVSLLLAIVKALLAQAAGAKQEAQKLPPPVQPRNISEAAVKSTSIENKPTRHDISTDTNRNNFCYLNKYLIVLSKQVKEMSQQFVKLQGQQHYTAETLPRQRLLKTVHARKYEKLNRSLERITENLKHMAHAKRRSKRVGAIVNAIETLATQFAKCATNFDNVSKDLHAHRTSNEHSERPQLNTSFVEKQTETETREKTYTDWVHEMRNTSNGLKFLQRIDISLRKAMNKQKAQLEAETEVKLRHQKELLKIRYKQKLVEHLSKNPVSTTNQVHNDSTDQIKLNENVVAQLRQFESKHLELLQKLREIEAETKVAPQKEPVHHPVEQTVDVIREKSEKDISKSPSTPTRQQQRLDTPISLRNISVQTPPHSFQIMDPVLKDAVNTQKQLQKMVKNIVDEERSVDHIIYDAKLRLQQLENESNQLDQSFRDYLERQRAQKESSLEAATQIWHSYAEEREKMREKFSKIRQSKAFSEKMVAISDHDEEENVIGKENLKKMCYADADKDKANTFVKGVNNNTNNDKIEFKNAILEAKEKFFNGEHMRQKMHNGHGDNASTEISSQLPITLEESSDYGGDVVDHQYVMNAMSNDMVPLTRTTTATHNYEQFHTKSHIYNICRDKQQVQHNASLSGSMNKSNVQQRLDLNTTISTTNALSCSLVTSLGTSLITSQATTSQEAFHTTSQPTANNRVRDTAAIANSTITNVTTVDSLRLRDNRNKFQRELFGMRGGSKIPLPAMAVPHRNNEAYTKNSINSATEMQWVQHFNHHNRNNNNDNNYINIASNASTREQIQKQRQRITNNNNENKKKETMSSLGGVKNVAISSLPVSNVGKSTITPTTITTTTTASAILLEQSMARMQQLFERTHTDDVMIEKQNEIEQSKPYDGNARRRQQFVANESVNIANNNNNNISSNEFNNKNKSVAVADALITAIIGKVKQDEEENVQKCGEIVDMITERKQSFVKNDGNVVETSHIVDDDNDDVIDDDDGGGGVARGNDKSTLYRKIKRTTTKLLATESPTIITRDDESIIVAGSFNANNVNNNNITHPNSIESNVQCSTGGGSIDKMKNVIIEDDDDDDDNDDDDDDADILLKGKLLHADAAMQVHIDNNEQQELEIGEIADGVNVNYAFTTTATDANAFERISGNISSSSSSSSSNNSNLVVAGIIDALGAGHSEDSGSDFWK